MNLLNAKRIETLVSEFCAENQLSVQLSFEMPAGYETAFGTYDVTVNTLFFNLEMLKDAPEYEVLFYLYHELRHTAQYLHPEMFGAQIRESRVYVILYNGICYKLASDDWQECALEGDESYFTNAYLSLPYLRVPKGFKPIAIKTIMNFYRDIAEVLPVLIEDDIAGGGFEMYVVLPPAKNKPPVSEDGFWHAGMEEYLNWLEDETVYMIGSHEKLNELHDMKAADNLVCPNHQDIITMDMATALYQKRRESTAYITDFISDTETIDFDLLIRIDSLSHSTGAWLTNGEALVKNGEANFREVPASREDIWTAIAEALDKRGIHDYSLALQVMDDSRKGVYFSRGLPKNLEKYLLSLELPRWFPCYLKQVKYLSPKGHCVALLIVDLMYEWYALHSCQHRTPTVQG